MKIVTWNCAGALRKKIKEINVLDADILVIQECENPLESTNDYKIWAEEYLWIGKNKNKGLGIFPKKGNKIKQLNWNGHFKINGLKTKSSSISWTTEELEFFLPFSVGNQFIVLGVWTKGSEDQAFSYVGQFWKYLQIHRNQLENTNVIILGDFNSNAIWDKKDRWWSHSGVVEEPEDMGIKSVYHYQKNEPQGRETTPTFFHRKNLNKSYHIDYVFCSNKLLPMSNLSIGKPGDWLTISDHVPLTLNINS